MAKATSSLAKATGMLEAWPDEAGRLAYLAGMHAAQALIFTRTGRVVRTHNGVQREFLRLTRDDPRFDTTLRGFLGRTYALKTIADYETNSGVTVTRERAAEAIAAGERFVTRCALAVEDQPASRE